MAQKLSAVRLELEAALAGRVAAPFDVRNRQIFETVSAGISEIDLLAGGLPRGGLTEIYGPFCSGRTSLLLSALASRTTTGEVCALVDGCDAFDPHSARAAGVELKKLLWVRCRNLDHAIRSTDLLLQGGGFSLIALDLSDVSAKNIRHVPLHVWFRLRRAVENTPTILMLLNRDAQAKTCATLVLHLEARPARRITVPEIREPVVAAQVLSPQALEFAAADGAYSSWTCLFDGFEVHAERIRSRVQFVTDAYGGDGCAPSIASTADSATTFKTKAIWNYFSRARSGAFKVKQFTPRSSGTQ